MTEDEALFQKGMPIRREVLGPDYVDASMARADEFMMSFQRATTAWAWGWAWGEGTLDRLGRVGDKDLAAVQYLLAPGCPLFGLAAAHPIGIGKAAVEPLDLLNLVVHPHDREQAMADHLLRQRRDRVEYRIRLGRIRGNRGDRGENAYKSGKCDESQIMLGRNTIINLQHAVFRSSDTHPVAEATCYSVKAA